MNPATMIWMLELSRDQFKNTLSVFDEKDSTWKPDETSLTVSQQVAHLAQANDWFFHGITKGFDAPFDSSTAGDYQEVVQFTSLKAAEEWLDKSYAKLIELVKVMGDSWENSFPSKPRFGGKPKWAALVGLVDHSGHHRGMLQVYARLMGKTNRPSLPYH